jgi:hypothetical protein
MHAELVWGVFARLLAAIYIIAFLSLRTSIAAFAGSRGLSPVAEKLARMRADLGEWRAAARQPTLLWLADSDLVVGMLPLAGAVTALLALCGVASMPMFAATWVIYLSCDVAAGMTYPWESMLLESGFLAMVLPPLDPLPSLRMTQAPAPLLMFAFQFLLFRVLFGFGKTKFTRAALDDPMYLRGFLISQPLPSPLGWRAARWPRALLASSHASLFAIEMVLPFLIFFPGWPRLVAASGFTALMIGIQAMGSFGFFNVLTVTLCVTLLDARAVTEQSLPSLASPYGVLIAVVSAWSVLAGLCHLPFNTWVARGWLEWPAWGALTGAGRAVAGVLRAAMPFRTVHAYGVFPSRMGPPVRFIPVVEGTRDGEHWETFEYRYIASTETSPPRFVAPHCPRLDHLMLYEGFGLGPGNYLGTIFSQGNPYDFSPIGTLDRLLERLMEPESPVRDLFRVVPFGGVPPIRMRMRLYSLTPTTAADARTTGRHWRRDLVREHLAERGSDPAIFERWLPAPEQFHPDERWARRRVPRLRPLLSARRLDDVRQALDARAQSLWEPFWHDVIPAATRASDAGWSCAGPLARQLKQAYGLSGFDDLDRIRGAVATALLERMDPHVLGLAEARFKVRSYFHASLHAHAVMLRGQAQVERALADEAVLLEGDASDSELRGLVLLTIFHFDMMEAHARAHRLMTTTLPPAAPVSEVVPGFLHVVPLLAAALAEPDEHIPDIQQQADGEWTIDGVPVMEHYRTGRVTIAAV